MHAHTLTHTHTHTHIHTYMYTHAHTLLPWSLIHPQGYTVNAIFFYFIARVAAINRVTAMATGSSQTTPTHLLLTVPSLESLCTKFLISSSRSHGFPSCASLIPMVAQRLLSSLMEEKRLNSRVLASFHGW